MSLREIARITEAYRRYDLSGEVQARRDSLNPGNLRIGRERSAAIVEVLDERHLLPLTEKRVLDLGCGRGGVLASLRDLGAQPHNLYGMDLLSDRIEAASQAYPDIHFICGNAEHLKFPDNYFDLMLIFTVFSSIVDDAMAHNVASEVHRVLKPGGSVLWYDFRYNNIWNPHVRRVTKRDICQLFPGFEIRLRTLTVLPLLARRLGRLTPVIYPVLAAIPPLRTHYLGLLFKPM